MPFDNEPERENANEHEVNAPNAPEGSTPEARSQLRRGQIFGRDSSPSRGTNFCWRWGKNRRSTSG